MRQASQMCKILATKGVRQVAKMTSGERGSTVTVICAMSAAGVYLPPMMIFPRKRMLDILMNGAPPQSVGYASRSGWTDSQLFIKWLEHFVKFTNASPEKQQIIVIDGHHSHIRPWRPCCMPENTASTSSPFLLIVPTRCSLWTEPTLSPLSAPTMLQLTRG